MVLLHVVVSYCKVTIVSQLDEQIYIMKTIWLTRLLLKTNLSEWK